MQTVIFICRITFLFVLFHLLIPATPPRLPLFIVDCNYSDNHDGKGATLLVLLFLVHLVAPTDFLEIPEKRHYGAVKSLHESQPVPFFTWKPL